MVVAIAEMELTMRTTVKETLRNDEIILNAAIKIFSEKGYDAASMQDIADEARISRGPLYYRYKTKKDIYLAAMDAYAERELGLQSEIFLQDKPFSQKLKDYLLFPTKNILNNQSVFPMDIFSSPDMQDVNERIREIYAWAFTLTKRWVQQAIKDGDLSPETDADYFVHVLFVAFDGLRYSRLKTGIIPTDQLLETIIELIEQICHLLMTGYGIE